MSFKVLTISIALILIAFIASAHAGEKFRKRKSIFISIVDSIFDRFCKKNSSFSSPVQYCLTSSPLADCIRDCNANGYQGGHCDNNDNCFCYESS